MAIEWSLTSREQTESGVKILVYAGAGSGKTMLCATAPRPVVLSAERGLRSLNKANVERVYGVNTPGISYDIPVMQIRTVPQFEEAYQYFANPANRAKDHFSTACIDSISDIAESLLSTLKASMSNKLAAYGDMGEYIIDRVRKWRNLSDFNVYMTAKMDYTKDEGSGIMKYGPLIPGKETPKALPYLFDEVFHLGVAKPQNAAKYRYIRTDSDPQYEAKDRSGTLAEIEEPNLTKIINKINGVTA